MTMRSTQRPLFGMTAVQVPWLPPDCVRGAAGLAGLPGVVGRRHGEPCVLRVAWCARDRLSVTTRGIELDSAGLWCNVMGPPFATRTRSFLPLLIWVGRGG
jgi:hypothetical protein